MVIFVEIIVGGVLKMTTADHKLIIEQNKEQIYRLKQQVAEATDPGEKRKLKRRLRQAQIEQIKYLNKLA